MSNEEKGLVAGSTFKILHSPLHASLSSLPHSQHSIPAPLEAGPLYILSGGFGCEGQRNKRRWTRGRLSLCRKLQKWSEASRCVKQKEYTNAEPSY